MESKERSSSSKPTGRGDMKQEKVYCDRDLCATQLQNNEGCDKCIAGGDMKDADFERMAEEIEYEHYCGKETDRLKFRLANALRQAHKEGFNEAIDKCHEKARKNTVYIQTKGEIT